MKEYATKDIANIVEIATPTVRKYAQALEIKSYKFIKNDRGFRTYTDTDIQLFKRMKELSSDTGMNIESIAEKVIREHTISHNEAILNESEVDTLKENDRYDTILSEVKQLKELILAQQEYIDKKLSERDKRIVESIRQLQETKQLTATAKEKKGFFARLFR
jgi:DNA-binding transcriptional MerR regulator